MAKLELLQADYKTLSRTVVRRKRKGVLVETLRRFESNRINSVVDHKYKPCTSFGDNLYMRVFRKQLS